MLDAYKYKSQIEQKILHLLIFRFSHEEIPDVIFYSKVSYLLETYQVRRDLRREAMWDIYWLYYKRQMNPDDEKKLLELYPP